MLVIGVDEVGLGTGFGPVVACAYHPYPQFVRDLEKLLEWGEEFGGRDSKKRTPRQRAALIPMLREYGQYQIGVGTVAEINSLNVCRAALLAMRRSVEGLISKTGISPMRILVDGRNSIPGIGYQIQFAVVKGDTKYAAIASASIIAKQFRDGLICHLATWPQFSGYGLETHKGYTASTQKGQMGTHELAIARHGMTPLHHVNNRAVRAAHAQFLGIDPMSFNQTQQPQGKSQLCQQLQQLQLSLL